MVCLCLVTPNTSDVLDAIAVVEDPVLPEDIPVAKSRALVDVKMEVKNNNVEKPEIK